MKLFREILIYAALAVVLAYAARQLEGVSVGRIDTDAGSFLEFFDDEARGPKP